MIFFITVLLDYYGQVGNVEIFTSPPHRLNEESELTSIKLADHFYDPGLKSVP